MAYKNMVPFLGHLVCKAIFDNVALVRGLLLV